MCVTVIGAGLAGCEAAWQLAQRGIFVRLCEMKPRKMTPAHHSPGFAELVCSNSLRSDQLENAVGLLKEELRRCGSLILRCADQTRVEAGGALAVDREGFSAAVTAAVRNHPNITIAQGEAAAIPDGEVVVASGPLTSDALSQAIAGLFPENRRLNFSTRRPPSSPLTALIWITPGLPPGTTGGRRTTSTVRCPRRSTCPFGGSCAPPRRRRFTASRTKTCSRAVCRWR